MAEGTLTNMIANNELHSTSVIMIDEAHERSLNINLLLGLLKKQLLLFPYLKLIIASATTDTESFINFFGGPTKVGFYQFPAKRRFTVNIRFREYDPIPITQMYGRMPEEVAAKAFEILYGMETGEESVRGDILAFLPDKNSINRTLELLGEKVNQEPLLTGKVDIFPLFFSLPAQEQDRALTRRKDTGRYKRYKAVISTSVAETSLTVDDIVHVIDTGLINESQWDPRTQTSFVVHALHSQAGCKQRWGRAGRIKPGVAHCLYTEEQFKAFPEFSIPEIYRAPLDQFILTAKTAGADNIFTFDWIQRPSEDELTRVYNYLKQIGALDSDGDLTNHGDELSKFTEGIEVANSMILADRFGCAVEMATLIPMLKLGGYRSLFQWDRNWDAQTRYLVNLIHKGLVETCLDDTEFCLKMWTLWEGNLSDVPNSQVRNDWAKHFFINTEVFQEIGVERETLLASLAGNKKDKFFRPINIDLLNRVRIILLYGQSQQVFQHKLLQGTPAYISYYPDQAVNSSRNIPNEGLSVQISDNSVCFGKNPELFVCRNLQRRHKRTSPLQSPEAVITAEFITVIKQEWLSIIGQSFNAIVRLIKSETKDSEEKLIPPLNHTRLFIDQIYPIGASVECQTSPDGEFVTITRMKEPPPILWNSRSFGYHQSLMDVNELESLNKIDEEETKGELIVHNDDNHLQFGNYPNEDYSSPWIEGHEEDKYIFRKLTILDGVEKVNGHIVYGGQTIINSAPFIAIVVGYDLANPEQPLVLLEIPPEVDPFDTFTKIHRPGDDINVELVSIEKFIHDNQSYLVVREVETGLRFVLDSYDANLLGRNFAIEVLRAVELGRKFSATVEEINPDTRRVHVNFLKNSIRANQRLLMNYPRGKPRGIKTFLESGSRQAARYPTRFGRINEKPSFVDASIEEVRENGLYLWLDPGSIKDNLPSGAFVHIGSLPQRPEKMVLGHTCKVQVTSHNWERPLRCALPIQSDKVDDALSKTELLENVKWEKESGILEVRYAMSYAQRSYLFGLSEDWEYRNVIDQLFRRSNQLDVQIIEET
jgi:HrpA-like RNA helicase